MVCCIVVRVLDDADCAGRCFDRRRCCTGTVVLDGHDGDVARSIECIHVPLDGIPTSTSCVLLRVSVCVRGPCARVRARGRGRCAARCQARLGRLRLTICWIKPSAKHDLVARWFARCGVRCRRGCDGRRDERACARGRDAPRDARSCWFAVRHRSRGRTCDG